MSQGARYNDTEELERGDRLYSENEAKLERVRALVAQLFD